ncbi:MAG: alanine racemase [Candidatus Nomurabacteria bacterium]|nr:alanine racemase [Candidatus Nomurabacteria bacterium]
MPKDSPLSYVELSKGNLIHNIKVLKSFARKGSKFAVAVKGNAYGHGQNEVVKILEKYVDYFQVDGIEELELLRRVSQKKTFVFGYVQQSDLTRAIKIKSILTFYSLEQLRNINEYASRMKLKQEVHMPVDAELGREGFLESEWKEIFTEVKKFKWVKLSGLYAHFANIEDTNNLSYAKKQTKKFQKAITLARKLGFKNFQTHISATSGLLVYEKDKGIHSILRLGIGVYGMWPSEHIKFIYKNKMELKPVLSWKTKVTQIKLIPAGHSPK